MIWYEGGPGATWPEGVLGWNEETAETAAEVMVTGVPSGRTHWPGLPGTESMVKLGRAPACRRGGLDAHGSQDER